MTVIITKRKWQDFTYYPCKCARSRHRMIKEIIHKCEHETISNFFFFLSGIEQGWKKTVCLHQWKVNNPRETNISQNHLYNWLLSKKNKVRMNSLTAEHDKTATKKALQLLGYSCFRDKTIFWSLINKRPRLILSWSFLHQFCIRNHHLLKLFCNNRSPPQFQQDRFTFPLDSLMHILRPLVIMPLYAKEIWKKLLILIYLYYQYGFSWEKAQLMFTVTRIHMTSIHKHINNTHD